MRVLRQIGTNVRQLKASWSVTGNEFTAPSNELFCGDSAATFRFMTALCSIIPGTSKLTAGPSLGKRPVGPLIDALRQLGVKCSANGNLPPVTIEGGRLAGGTTSLPGDVSSQYVSALLLVAPFAQNTMTVKLTTPLESRPYVMMTLDTMQWYGVTVAFNESMDEFTIEPQRYDPSVYTVEGDFSSASYLLALGALAGKVEVTSLPVETMQADRMILPFLQEMGASIKRNRKSIIVTQSKLKAIKTDLTDCIDLLPTMAVLAAASEGTSVFTGIARARVKESDRIAAMREGLARLGIRTTEEKDRLTVTGGKFAGTRIDSKNDHRIAMAFSLLGVLQGSVTIDGAECVTKTYPEYWDVLKGLGGEVNLIGK
jgi:3-phosphoshikimate 1-carboxyvinyltransferase